MPLDHVIYGAADLAATAAELERLHGLSFLPGGRHPGGTVNMAAPLADAQYLELLGVEEALDDEAHELERRIRKGRTLLGWGIVVDDIGPVAARLDVTPVVGSITRDDGVTGRWRIVSDPGDALPFFIQYDRDPGERRASWEERRRAVGNDAFGGFTFVEVGGDRARLEAWLGPEAAAIPVRYVDGEPGLRRVGIAGDAGEIVLD